MTDAFGLSDIALWAIIVGFATPLVVAVATRPNMKPAIKVLIQIVFVVIVATFTAYLNGAFTGRNIVSAILLVASASIIAYKGIWKPTGVADAIESNVLGGPTHADAQVPAVAPVADTTVPQDTTDATDDGSVVVTQDPQ